MPPTEKFGHLPLPTLRELIKERSEAGAIHCSGKARWQSSKKELVALLEGKIDRLTADIPRSELTDKQQQAERAQADAEATKQKLLALTEAKANVDRNEVLKVVLELIEPLVKDQVDSRIDAWSDIPNLVDKELAKRTELRPVIDVHLNGHNKPKRITERTHKLFPEVLRRVRMNIPTLLVGPSGSGKTIMCRQLAAALEIPFSFNGMSLGITEAKIFGSVRPNETGSWMYQESQYVKSYREGGLHLWDEIDAADPNLLVSINAPMTNGFLSIPGTSLPPIPVHEDHYTVAAANTYGHGADRQYVGRNQLDAATVDRYNQGTFHIDYDIELEHELMRMFLSTDDKTETEALLGIGKTMLDWAWTTRIRIHDSRLRRIMSTRTIVNAAKRIRCGDQLSDIQETYFLSWSMDERSKVL